MDKALKTAVPVLPEEYKRCYTADILRDFRILKKLLLCELAVCLPLLVLGLCLVPLKTLFAAPSVAARLLLLLAVLAAYVFAHEGVHALFMKLFGAGRITLKFHLGAASAHSDEFFRKNPYIVVALSPVVLLGAVLIAACALVPRPLFWAVYPALLLNFSGASADYYVVHHLIRTEKTAYVRDYGTKLQVFTYQP